MKTYSTIIVFVLFTISCSRNSKKESIEEFLLYGYSGFVFIDTVDYIFDSTKLNLICYFDYNKDSIIKIIQSKRLNRYFRTHEYYTIDPLKYPGLQDSLDTYLLKNKFENKYLPGKNSLYSGWYFSIYYKTNGQKESLINYTPDDIPDSLKLLHLYILDIIIDASHKGSEFTLSNIVKKDALNLYKTWPPPPPPGKENVQFVAPIVIDTIKK